MARTMNGTVVSDKAAKTIIVAVLTRKTHPIYKKQYSVTKRFMAHDEKEDAHVGDKVEIIECRPLSARKAFTLNKITEKARVTHVTEADAVEVEKVTTKSKDEAKS